MSAILLLHSALGLRPAVRRFADRLGGQGHTLVVPDYYDGVVFDDQESGLAHRDAIGGRALLTRLHPTIDALPDDAVLAGFSLGAAFAQRLAADRPRAAAVILLHHVSAPRVAWPGQPVQLHRYADDPFVDGAAVSALRSSVSDSGSQFQDFVTPGSGHLFTDTDLADGDSRATDRTLDRIGTLLNALPGPR